MGLRMRRVPEGRVITGNFMTGRGVGTMEKRSMSRIGIMLKRKNGLSRLCRKKIQDQKITRGDMIKDDFIKFINSNQFIYSYLYNI